MTEKSLSFKRRNVWEVIPEEHDEIFKLGQDYRDFLDTGKTERLAVKEIIKRAEAVGFKNMDEILKAKKTLRPGDKVYKENKEKGVALFVIGKKDIIDGMHIVGSHVDSPRLDLKQVPLYEDSDMAYLKTHYYGGIVKYQWVALPLEMYGVLYKRNGERLDIAIGDKEEDPVFYITDILPHLGKDQYAKTAREVISGEGLNLLIGTIPAKDAEDAKVKENVLKILNEKYGIEEEDFVSAEIEIVPAGKSRDVGFDRSMIAGYGHDDRVCAYASLKAVLETENPETTALGLFVDKEEIGNTGNSGMSSKFLRNTVMDLVYLLKQEADMYVVDKSLANSKALSADVAAAFDPEFASAFEKNNTSKLGHGLALIKYTGSGGKYSCNDANPEFISFVRNVFNENNIVWQTGELGKVDQGGGGTIAYILAQYGMEVVDCGVPVLSMHATHELVSKADVYMTYKGYKAFFMA